MPSLNDLMEFDHVIEITEEGNVTDAPPGIYAPEVTVECLSDDAGSITAEAEERMITYVRRQGWDLMTGYTGQYAYDGPIMHVSEFVGGRLEQDIRSTPGFYVVVEATCLYPSEEAELEHADEPAGWVVAQMPNPRAAYRKAKAAQKRNR